MKSVYSWRMGMKGKDVSDVGVGLDAEIAGVQLAMKLYKAHFWKSCLIPPR